MSQPREWPNNATSHRDTAAEQSLRGIRALRPLIAGEDPLTSIEIMRRQAIALDAFHTIALAMCCAGAAITTICKAVTC
jgi:hypothetical protein